MMGWSRERVKDYVALRKISPEAWAIIGGFFDNSMPAEGDEAPPKNGGGAPFTETLLRDILPLSPEQQLELVQALAMFSKM